MESAIGPDTGPFPSTQPGSCGLAIAREEPSRGRGPAPAKSGLAYLDVLPGKLGVEPVRLVPELGVPVRRGREE